ncbi:MAG: gliding motility-associated C-terminal domain-containing protein [Bacteroidetes bacterium]|nr:gliding motility-associated C-terminal domain-containing protein [Bacteroidota bacterium]MBS1541065.1 gliding motility-associated C-terminal domain-containing protein [Bacteroidota bacterium]
MKQFFLFALFCFLSLHLFAEPGVTFIENKGQWCTPFHFGAKTNGVFFGIETGKFSYVLINSAQLDRHYGLASYHEEPSQHTIINGYSLNTHFLNYNAQALPNPFGKHSSYFNFFLKSPEQWRSDVGGFDGAIYADFYCGIDLKVYSESSNIKYDFIVAPGADPGEIQWRYEGAESILTADGNLTVKTPLGSIHEQKPVAYQLINNSKIFIDASYHVTGSRIGFRLGHYDTCYPLVIDPMLIFSTYSGSTADNWGSTATPGEKGTLYSSGITNLYIGGTFPATAGAFQTHYGGIFDVAILKYDSTGHQLLYASYLGGSFSESPHSLVIDKDQNLLVLGTTSSYDFPTSSNAYKKTFSGGVPIPENSDGKEIPIPYENGSDIFITKISKDGKQLLASTYLGGTNNDGLNPNSSLLVKNYGDQMRGDIIGDTQGNIYVSTVTSSSDFPTANSFNQTYKGGLTDAVILKMNSDLSQLVWSTFMGGSATDASHTIQLDNKGNLFVGGGTSSIDFPVTAGAYQTTQAGDVDGWMAKIKADGSAILQCTFTGTSLFNQVYFLDIDKNKNVYVYGQTVGVFPVTTGAYNNPASGQFVQKFDSTLSTLLFSTVFGSGIGIPNISPTAFLVNDCNNIFLSGWGGLINSRFGYWNSSTFNMPITSTALQKNTSGSDFYFMVLSQDGKQLLYSTYLGGPDSRTHVDGGTCRFDKKGVVYHVVCSGCQALNALDKPTSDFPTTPNAWSRVNRSMNCNNAAFKFDLASLRAIIQTNSVHLNQPGINQICLGDKIVFQNLSIGGQSFTWSFGNSNQLVKPDTGMVIYQYAKPGTYPIRLKVVDNGTCMGKDSTATSVTVYAPIGSAGKNFSMCFGTQATLEASGGTSYQWATSDKSFTSSNQNPQVSPVKSTDYFVTIQDLHGCISKDTLAVTVVPGIDLKFKANAIFGCDGRPPLKLENLTDPAEEVFFDLGDGTTSDQPQITHDYATDGSYTIRLIGKKEFCVYEKSVTLPFYYRFVPNVITPEESPGLNDAFMLQYGSNKPAAGVQPLVRVSLTVVDRWGKWVYQNSNYQNDWTAKNVNGGYYFFEAVIQDETTCKGWLQVIK